MSLHDTETILNHTAPSLPDLHNCTISSVVQFTMTDQIIIAVLIFIQRILVSYKILSLIVLKKSVIDSNNSILIFAEFQYFLGLTVLHCA